MNNWDISKLRLIEEIKKDIEEATIDSIPRDLEIIRELNKVYRVVKEVLEKHKELILSKSK